MSRAVKKKDFSGKTLVDKEQQAQLRGTIIILDPEQSEIAQKLQIKEKGIYGMKFK